MKVKMILAQIVQRIGHKAEHFAHMTYLGAVGIEGHGKYRYAAIALLMVVVLNVFVGGAPAEVHEDNVGGD